MLGDFLVRAALAGVGVALAAGPLGCFVLWRRMAYFSDATAHGALCGVALSLVLNLPIAVGVLFIALALALLLSNMSGRMAADGFLGVFAHGSLAFGLLAVATVPSARVDLSAYLLGDILAVGPREVILIWVGAAVVLLGLFWRWSSLLTATLDPDLAVAAGIRPDREMMFLTVALAIVVAVAIQVVGALLIGALLILPAAAMRPLARSPEALAILAAVLGAASALGGVLVSMETDLPTGPTIVVLALGVFVVVHIAVSLRRAPAGRQSR